VQIGYVVRAHGVRGLVRVRAGDSLVSLERVFVGGEERRVLGVRRERGDYLVELEGVGDRAGADTLRGALIEVEREALPPPEAGELYVADLVGCGVVDLGGTVLGVVSEVFHSGAHEVLVVARQGGTQSYIPFVEPIIREVDLEGWRIVCDPPEGLVEEP